MAATDIAARGLDVSGIELVVNYDLPEQAEDYVHRIGRTARAERTGHAISLATPDQKRDVRDIERLIKKQSLLPTHLPLKPILSLTLPCPNLGRRRLGIKIKERRQDRTHPLLGVRVLPADDSPKAVIKIFKTPAKICGGFLNFYLWIVTQKLLPQFPN